jgi:lipoate-protein ligase B
VPYPSPGHGRNLGLKKRFRALKRWEDRDNCLVVLQHPPVYALGTGNSNGFFIFNLENPPLELHRTKRGGVLCRSLWIFQRRSHGGLEKRLL